MKEALMEQIPCKDHELMGTDTYYPPRGACFRYGTIIKIVE